MGKTRKKIDFEKELKNSRQRIKKKKSALCSDWQVYSPHWDVSPLWSRCPLMLLYNHVLLAGR